MEAIYTNIEYPQEAMNKRLEGTVVVQVFVNKKGYVTYTHILNGIDALNNAAVYAIKITRFSPAMQRDRPLGAYIILSILFKIK